MAQTTQTIIADIDRNLLAAPEGSAALLTLHAILLHELRPATQEGPQESPLEGVILDALDMVTGWCTPQLRVWDGVGDDHAS